MRRQGTSGEARGTDETWSHDSAPGPVQLWLAAVLGAVVVLGAAVDLAPALGVLFGARAPALAWPWAILPVVVAVLLLSRLPAGPLRRVLRAGIWVAFWIALPAALGASLGGASGRNASWLVLVGAVEVVLAILVYRALRDAELRRRDPLALSLGRLPGILGDRLLLRGADRFLHMTVLGPTGSGKTQSVLLPSVRQDLERGAGVTVVDPKGDLAARVERECERLGRPFALLRPGDPRSGRLNPLAGPPAEAAETVVYAFDRAFPGDHPFYRPLGQNLLRFSTRALVEVEPGAGLDDLSRFLQDDQRRLEVLVRVEDDTVRRYFRDVFATWPARLRAEYTAGVVNALLALLGQPELAELFRPPATIDLEAHMASSGVLVADLPVGRLGAASPLAGALLLAALQRIALGRPESAPAHFLYVDEFGTFAPAGFGEFLEMARSRRVGAILAHQHLAQLPPALRAAAEANARSRIVLGGVSPDDGAAIARLAAGGGRGDDGLMRAIRQLPRGEAVVLRVDKGQAKPPARLLLPRPPRPAADA